MTDLSTLSNADLQALYGKASAANSVSQMSDEELKAAYAKPSGVMDFVKSIPSGLVKGLSSAASAGGQSAVLEMGQQDTMGDVPNAPEVAKHLEKNVTGELPKPQGRAGKYGETVGEFLGNPASYIGPGGLPLKIATGVTGALGSEAAGQATEGTKAEPFARVAGAMLGGTAPSVGARVVTPLPASPARQRLVDILNNEGVTSLTAGQRTGNESLRYAESALGNAPFAGQQTNKITRQGQEQFTEAATRRAGTGPDATPDTLAANQRRLGNEFDQLSARNTLQMDPQFATDIRGVIRDYGRVLPSEQRERVFNVIADLLPRAPADGHLRFYHGGGDPTTGGGRWVTQDPLVARSYAMSNTGNPNSVFYADIPEKWLSGNTGKTLSSNYYFEAPQEFAGQMKPVNAIRGDAYQATRSRLSRVANNNRMSDPDFADAMRGIRNALDDAMGRSISPADQAAWQAARQEYGAQKVIEKAASRAGEATAEGQIVPTNLRNTVSAENRGAYARGEGPFSELARAGAGVMAPMPQSGTAPRSMIYHLMNWGSAGALPAAMGRTLMSRPVQAYLGNQLIPGQVDPRRAAVVNALIAAQHQAGE